MQDAIIYLQPDSRTSLQHQIRQKLVDGVLNGAFPPGMKLPSSRTLASQLGVARNTVVAAYQQLISEGYLVSRQRSGIFVNEKMLESRISYSGSTVSAGKAADVARLVAPEAKRARSEYREMPNWREYRYPFVDGRYDASLFPVNDWREAMRLAMGVAEVADWSTGAGDTDDPMLIEEIRTKVLTRRGIQARPDEILVTLGTQNSLYLVCQLLASRETRVAMENPGNPAMRELLLERGASLQFQAVDEHGLVVDEALEAADLVYTTPSHQVPTAVTMSVARRQELMRCASLHDCLVIEDDYECETSYMDHPLPALRSMDEDGRVVYVASLSNVLAPGVRLGFIVASAEFIRRARDLRRTLFTHPPLLNQRAAAYFLSLGHYDALMLNIGRILRERRMALRDALDFTRGIPIEISPEVGGSTYWVRTPQSFDVGSLAIEAQRQGILIEPVERYYADPASAERCIRMGVTSLPREQIRAGVEKLIELIRSLVRDQVEHLDSSRGNWLRGEELQQALSGATVLYREVYGAPCTIVHHADGRMTGTLGFASEEKDYGRWYVKDDLFYRRWTRWNYGEEKAYYVVIDADKIKYFNSNRQIVDSAFIRVAGSTPPSAPA